MIIGWIGLLLVMLSFIILNTKYFNMFLLLNSLGTTTMIVYAWFINDWPFLLANAFILLMLLVKYFTKDIKIQLTQKEFPCIETTVDVIIGKRTVRLWIDNNFLEDNFEYEKEMAKFIKCNKHLATNQLLRDIAANPFINAIQVIHHGKVKYGTVVYTVDFSDDVHG